jgi:sigma-B regulation protein RsbU (phosphoserine phosphatase)
MQSERDDHERWIKRLEQRLTTALGRSIALGTAEQARQQGRQFIPVERSDVQSRGFLAESLPAAEYELLGILGESLGRLGAAERELATHRRDAKSRGPIRRQPPENRELASSLEYLLRVAAQLGQFWTAALFVIDPEADRFRPRALYHLAPGDIPRCDRSLSEDSPDMAALELGGVTVSRSGGGIDWLPSEASLGICVPVKSHGEAIGTLWCFERRHRLVTQHDMDLLRSIGGQIAELLEQAAVARELHEHQHLQRELKYAGRMPSSARYRIDPGGNRSLDLAIRSDGVREVSGDWCEVRHLEDDRLLLVVGDAVGHSIPAAMVMSAARGALHALLTESTMDLTTGKIMGRINRALHSVTRSEQFLTAIVAIYDQSRRELTYTNAGHPLPYLLRDGQAVCGEAHGLLLGVQDDATYGATTVILEPGDVLLLLTDGVTEAMNGERKIYRGEGVLNSLGDWRQLSAEEIAARIWRGLREHVRGGRQQDDRTLLVLRVPKQDEVSPPRPLAIERVLRTQAAAPR